MMEMHPATEEGVSACALTTRRFKLIFLVETSAGSVMEISLCKKYVSNGAELLFTSVLTCYL